MSGRSIANRAIWFVLRSTICGLAFIFAIAAPTYLPLMLGSAAPPAEASASPTKAPAAEPRCLGGDEHLLRIDDPSPNLTILPYDAEMAAGEINQGRWAVFFVPQWDSNAYAALHKSLSPLADALAEHARVGALSYTYLEDIEPILPARWRSRVTIGGFLMLYDDGKPIALFEDGHLPDHAWVRDAFAASETRNEAQGDVR